MFGIVAVSLHVVIVPSFRIFGFGGACPSSQSSPTIGALIITNARGFKMVWSGRGFWDLGFRQIAFMALPRSVGTHGAQAFESSAML